MNHMIIRSNKDLIEILGVQFIKSNEFYYSVIDTNETSFLTLFNDNYALLYNHMVNEIYKSDYVALWAQKESMYKYDKKKPDDNICYSQEYFLVKSKITEDILSIILVKDCIDIFKISAEIIGSYREFKESECIKLQYVTRYLDCIYNTPYDGVDFSSTENYIRTKNLGCI